MAGDALWPYVVLSTDCNGANGASANGQVDNRGKTFVTQAGSPITSTTWGAGGGSSFWFNGSARLQMANSADFNFGSGDFEIGMWMYQTTRSGAAPGCLIDFSSDTPAKGFRFAIQTNGALTMYVIGGAALSTAAAAVPVNTPTHVSVARVAGTATVRVNGVTQASAAMAAFTDFAGVMQFSGALGPNWVYTGFMDQIEILKGAARHSADFTPSTSALLNYAGQLSGVVRDDTGALCARTVRAIRRSTGAFVADALSNASTGAFSLNLPTLDEIQLLALDDFAGTTYNDLIARLIPA